jgi:Family of unknown function (DUF6491)
MKRLLTAAILMCATGPVFAQAPGDSPCLEQINMYSFNPVPGNRALVVEDRSHRRYRVNFTGPCTNLQFHLGLRFKTFGVSNLSCVSRGDKVLLHDEIGPNACIIQSVQYQTPALDQADAAAAERKKS